MEKPLSVLERLKRLEESRSYHNDQIDKLQVEQYLLTVKVRKLTRVITEMASRGRLDKATLIASYQKVLLDLSKEQLALFERRVKKVKEYKAPKIIIDAEEEEVKQEKRKLKVFNNKKAFTRYFNKYIAEGWDSKLEKLSTHLRGAILCELN